MKKIKKIILFNFIPLFLFLLIGVEYCFSKEIDSIVYKNLSSIEYSYMKDVDLLNDSLYFNGYLIFRILKVPDKGIFRNSYKTFICEIYWIYNLNDLEKCSDHFIYVSTLDFTISGKLAYFYEEEGNYENTNSVKNLRDFFYQYDSSRSSAFMKKNLKTDIFTDSTVFWNYQNIDSIGYFVFKNSFDAALLKTTLKYLNEDTNKEGRIKNAEILVPISEAYTFEPVSNEFLLKNGFHKSKWYPSDLKN